MSRAWGTRVLLVEDEALLAMTIANELSGAGMRTIGPAATVGDALELIEAAADGGIDAAILDVKLGAEMVTPVADRLAALGVPFLFATGYCGDWRKGAHASAPTLEKPYSHHALMDAVAALIARKVGGRCTGQS